MKVMNNYNIFITEFYISLYIYIKMKKNDFLLILK